MPLRELLQRARPDAAAGDAARLARELSRLDPWSFWVVPTAPEEIGEFTVVGTTGAFLVAACGLEGYLSGDGGRLDVAGRPVRGLVEVRRAARRFRGRLASSAVFTDVVPILCLTQAAAGAPRIVRGVLVVSVVDLVREITDRERVLLPSRAMRAAESLGLPVERHPRPRGHGE